MLRYRLLRQMTRYSLALLLLSTLIVGPLSSRAEARPTSIVAAQLVFTITPTSGPPGTIVQFAGTGFTPGGQATVLLVRGLGLIVAEVQADPNGGISGSFVMPSPQEAAEFGFGPVDVFAIDGPTGRETPSVVFNLTRPAGPVTTIFFAEGATTPPFDTWFLVQNPGPNQAVLTFTFQLLGGGTVVRTFSAGPRSRFSLFANQVLPNQAFSTRIDSDQPIFAERAMYVSFEGDIVPQITSPASVWLFAEGATAAPFHTWLLIQNPNAQSGTATITYLLEGGGTRTQVVSLPPTSRTSVFVNEVLPNAAFSTRVEGSVPIIVERAMYRFPGNAATADAGMPSPALTWFFAEGATTISPFGINLATDTFVLLQNPNNATVAVTITLFDTAGNTQSFPQTLAPLSRLNVYINQATNFSSFGIRVDASAPVIVERSMFFGPEPRGATATFGSPELATVWNFAEGSTAPPFAEIISVLNPSGQNMGVTIEFFLEGGQVITRQFTVGPNRKFSVDVDAIVPNAANSARVTTSVPSVVERAMYFLKTGGTGGHDTIGIR